MQLTYTEAPIQAVMAGLMLAIFLGALDRTIVAVALPAMAHEFRGFDLLSWVVSGYLVAMTATIPVYGKMSDLFGRRPVRPIRCR